MSSCPEAGREAGLALQRADELARLGERLPDLRQERRPPAAPGEHDAVDAGAQLLQQVVLAGDRQRHRAPTAATPRCAVMSSSRAGERREARVAKRGGQRVLLDVLPQRPVRLERADAAAQIAVLRAA